MTQTGFECPICSRACGEDKRSKHHLVPKSRRGKVTADICVDCHKQIHALFTERELEKHLSTLDTLRTHPKMQEWIRWVGRQPAVGRVRVRTSHAKRQYHQLKEMNYGAV